MEKPDQRTSEKKKPTSMSGLYRSSNTAIAARDPEPKHTSTHTCTLGTIKSNLNNETLSAYSTDLQDKSQIRISPMMWSSYTEYERKKCKYCHNTILVQFLDYTMVSPTTHSSSRSKFHICGRCVLNTVITTQSILITSIQTHTGCCHLIYF